MVISIKWNCSKIQIVVQIWNSKLNGFAKYVIIHYSYCFAAFSYFPSQGSNAGKGGIPSTMHHIWTLLWIWWMLWFPLVYLKELSLSLKKLKSKTIPESKNTAVIAGLLICYWLFSQSDQGYTNMWELYSHWHSSPKECWWVFANTLSEKLPWGWGNKKNY